MGQLVPADDLPSSNGGGGMAVPADDLPDSKPTPTGKTGFIADQFGPAEAALSFGSGMIAQPIAGLVGLAGSGLPGSVIPGSPEQGARWSENISNALTYQPRTQRGQDITGVLSIPGELIEKGASKVGERGAEVSPGLATVGHTSVHALPALLGARSMTRAKPPLTPKQAAAGEAMDAGFKLTPEEMGAGPVARTTASIAGEPRLAKTLTKANEGVVSEKIATDLGLPKGATLDLDTLRAIRAEAGKAYEAVRGTGLVTSDAAYGAALDKIAAKYQTVARDFPEVAAQTGAADAQAVINGLRKPSFDANSAVDLVGQLRRSADGAFRSGKTDVAKAMREGAEAVEGMLERHLAGNFNLRDGIPGGQLNRQQMMADFRAARERIAKTYIAEKALVGENINPQVYAKEYRKGKPLTGGAEEVGRAADKYERSLQKPTNQGTGATLQDLITGVLSGLKWGGTELPMLFARPGLRATLASRPGQYLMDPRTDLANPAQRALGIGSVPRPQEEMQ